MAANTHAYTTAALTAFAVEAGLIRPIPRMTGAYVVSRRVNARTFGEKFARWVNGE
ncbi:MAG: hypothetical protein Q4F65_12035 [Propionibacteriaceae bacterium]|nr:hypothetical protein [Propionibacteriaceae bacterium]